MAEFAIEFAVLCDKCNSPLTTKEDQYGRTARLFVEPCESCLSEANDAGNAEGYERGLEDGTGDDAAE